MTLPLLLSHTVIIIEGKNRLTGVVIAEVGQTENQSLERSTLRCSTSSFLWSYSEQIIKTGRRSNEPCNKWSVSRPESLETNIDGVFACGNVLHVHDLVDYVSKNSNSR